MSINWDQDVYIKAWNFATIAHHDQTYGGPNEGQRIEYINHVSSVTMEVIWSLSQSKSIDGNLAIQCALLHDVIEDTKVTYENIKFEFGVKVADGVSALTKDETLLTKHEQMVDSLQRIITQPREVWMVKLADRITNLSKPPSSWNNEKKKNYLTEAKLIHEYLGPSNTLLSMRLLSRVDNYEQYLS